MNQAQRLDLSAFPDSAPVKGLRLLFIHHSCGGQLLAAPGPDSGSLCIYLTHPNGGGLRSRLEQAGYEVHEASYGSKVGEHTNHFDWLPKFRQQMAHVLACQQQDTLYDDSRRNQIVVFKPCFPNNYFAGPGTPPGNPNGPELTVWNAQAAYQALLEEFRKHPEVLFVCMTPPPLALQGVQEPLWKQLARRVLRRGPLPQETAPLARAFNNWLSRTDGWLHGYPLKNVVVFDLYDVLTNGGASNWSCYPSSDGSDSHPSREGNEKAAAAFVPFLNRAVHRAGFPPCFTPGQNPSGSKTASISLPPPVLSRNASIEQERTEATEAEIQSQTACSKPERLVTGR